MLDLAEALIEKKAAKFDPAKFHDRYVDALKELIEKQAQVEGRARSRPRRRSGADAAAPTSST